MSLISNRIKELKIEATTRFEDDNPSHLQEVRIDECLLLAEKINKILNNAINLTNKCRGKDGVDLMVNRAISYVLKDIKRELTEDIE